MSYFKPSHPDCTSVKRFIENGKTEFNAGEIEKENNSVRNANTVSIPNYCHHKPD